MVTKNLNIRVDKDIKDQAEQIYADLGLNMSTAVNMFLRASIRKSGIPFDLKLDVPNEATRQAIEEARSIAYDKNIESFDNIKDLREALEI